MGRCKGCRHWDQELYDDDTPVSPYGMCEAIPTKGEGVMAYTFGMFIGDISGLMTLPDFGCMLYDAAALLAEDRRYLDTALGEGE
jgi:hypothetical protein